MKPMAEEALPADGSGAGSPPRDVGANEHRVAEAPLVEGLHAGDVEPVEAVLPDEIVLLESGFPIVIGRKSRPVRPLCLVRSRSSRLLAGAEQLHALTGIGPSLHRGEDGHGHGRVAEEVAAVERARM